MLLVTYIFINVPTILTSFGPYMVLTLSGKNNIALLTFVFYFT
jgi:hypothetical protein